MIRRDLAYLHRAYGAIAVREQIDEYGEWSAADAKAYPPLADRIYPGHYAPVIFAGPTDERSVAMMRYGAFPPAHIPDPGRYTTFNARLDNLTSRFWSEAFQHHHGFVVLERFYEWVAVKDLLAAGVVSLAQVKDDFALQAAARREKLLAAGKKWRPTPTEKKDARLRKTIIEFRPQDAQDLLVPVIFSQQELAGGRVAHGFAIITHDPPPEIAVAGHDRCPVVLPAASLPAWLHPAGQSAAALQALLADTRRVVFTHTLPVAASGKKPASTALRRPSSCMVIWNQWRFLCPRQLKKS